MLRTIPWDLYLAGLAFTGCAAVAVYLMRHYARYKNLSEMMPDYRTALRYLNQVIAADPTNAMAVWQKGEVYEAMGMADRAIRYYEIAHRLNPRAFGMADFSDARNRLRAHLPQKPAPSTPAPASRTLSA